METKRQMVSLYALCTPICASTVWENWYRFCMQQEQENVFTFSHVGCGTETLNPNGIRTRSRYLKKQAGDTGCARPAGQQDGN